MGGVLLAPALPLYTQGLCVQKDVLGLGPGKRVSACEETAEMGTVPVPEQLTQTHVGAWPSVVEKAGTTAKHVWPFGLSCK